MDKIGAVVLGAGLSRRMGSPKLLLPWGATTVIGKVVSTCVGAGAAEIVVVTGAETVSIRAALADLPATTVFNPDYQQGEMVSSLKVGLGALPEAIAAALVVLGDQPQIEANTISLVVGAYRSSQAQIVVPSYELRRGHPWLLHRSLWERIQSLSGERTMRDFLNEHAHLIHYVAVDTPGILKDLDTPQQYQAERPDA